MTRLTIAGVALALVLAPEAAMAQFDSRVGAPPMPPMSRPMPPMVQPMFAMPNMSRPMPGPGTPMDGRWGSVPGGWNAYRAPVYGYTLPHYWIAAPHYIDDYRGLGLPTPAFGYGWSRYYDDMVLTDRWGRVYDWRDGRDSRDRDGGDYRPRKRDRSGIVGALIGGAVGALTGNLIAGAGSRLAGSLIGGGVGALAGQAIDRNSHGRDHGGAYGNEGYGHSYRAQGPHWFMGDYQGGSYGYSCNCGGETVTTTTTTTYAQPIVTRTVRYVTEYVRVPAKHRVRHAPVQTKERYLGGS